ncbi:MAG: (Fe-S)-binding protein [Candidatus Heimdallarchaeota archaeon]|nr:(Fe-S)-binding protein [Candidatus Heimdallarchaeota archaeon]
MNSKTDSVDELLKKCVQCGSCVLLCPIYRATGQETFSPRGKLYYLKLKEAIPEKFDDELAKEFARTIFTCAFCGRCVESCSSEVELTEIFRDIRKDSVQLFPALEQIEENISEEMNVYGLDNEMRAESWTMELYDDFPDIDDRIYNKGMTADTILFVGCLMSFRSRHTNVLKSTIKILEYLDEDYLILGGEEYCCGHPLDLIGKIEEADKLRAHNTEVFHNSKAKTIITDCPGCLEALREHHKIDSSVRILHFSEYFDEKITHVPKKLNIKLKYHDPCELFRNNEINEAPRSLMRKMGIEIIEMEPSCCGGGGMLRVTDGKIAQEIIDQRIEKEKLKEEDTCVVTCCPSCLEQFEQSGVTTWDIIEYLVKALELEEE